MLKIAKMSKTFHLIKIEFVESDLSYVSAYCIYLTRVYLVLLLLTVGGVLVVTVLHQVLLGLLELDLRRLGLHHPVAGVQQQVI